MLLISLILAGLGAFQLASAENVENSALKFGQVLQLQCLQRDEDGEVLEDSNHERLYTPFLTCNETGYPPAFKYRHSTSKSRIPCTVTIDDPTFHLFQTYLHHDIPLVCRLPARRSEKDYFAHIPINLLGKVELSHLDIDPKINFIFHYDAFHGWVTGGVGYTLGPAVTSKTKEEADWQRLKIGDQLKLELSVRWISTEEISAQHNHSGSNALLVMLYPFLGGIGFLFLCQVLHNVLWSRQRIASVRHPARFETQGINMGKGKTKRERELV